MGVSILAYAEKTTILRIPCICARPSALLSQYAQTFKSKIQIKAKGKTFDVKSILMLMTAGLIRGTKITICAEGSDAQEAVNRIYSLIDDYGLGADEA